MSVFAFAIAIHGLSFLQVLLLLGALGFMGGFSLSRFNRPDSTPTGKRTHKGSVIAFANFLSFVGVIVASAIYSGATHYLHTGLGFLLHLDGSDVTCRTIYTVYLLPDPCCGCCCGLHAYAVSPGREGRENVPARAGALLTPNHVSMADAVLLIASIDRPIRFLMFKGS